MTEPLSQRPLRILEVVDTLDSGGMEQQLVSLINRLDPKHFAFEVCCLRHAGVNARKLNAGVPVHPLQKQEGFQWSAVRRMRGLLKARFDVVHTHNLAPLIYAALATSGGRAAPIFHGEHSQFNPSEFSAKRVWQRRFLYRCARAVHTVSTGQRNELLSAGIRHRHLVALLNGVNTEHFKPLPDASSRAAARAALGLEGDGTFWMGIVARFGAFKRHADLLRAFEVLAPQHPHLRLLMVGDGGPEKDSVLAMAGGSRFSARIHWAGYQADPAPWYQVMDLLAVPSSNEGLSNTTLEAMASAVPVLSNDICGAPELIVEGEGGWVRDIGTVDKLAAEIATVVNLQDPARASAGRRGRERAMARFSWSAMAENYAAWLTACARGAGYPAAC
jgi:glycosyltransferase involved in cell wall biosynthesis